MVQLQEQRHLFPGSNVLLHGDAPRQMLLLVGTPGAGKTTYIQRFLYDRLEQGDLCVYMLTDYTPEMAVENMRYLGFDVDAYVEEGLLRFVDCHSGSSGVESSYTYVVENVSNLTELSMKVNAAVEGFDEVCFALDSLSTLALNAGLNPTREFLRTLLIRQRRLKCMSVCSIEEGVVERSFESFLRAQYDGVLEMRLDVGDGGGFRRFLRVFTLRMARYTENWAEVMMGGSGIEIRPPLTL